VGHRVALEHKERCARSSGNSQKRQARQPSTLADQLSLLMDGAYMAARMCGIENPAANLASAAKTLNDAQISK
jgi:hypothetical protein